jgi:hypothetical protein
MNETAPAPVVPASAIVDDAGRPIVFVQVEGESFERRLPTSCQTVVVTSFDGSYGVPFFSIAIRIRSQRSATLRRARA